MSTATRLPLISPIGNALSHQYHPVRRQLTSPHLTSPRPTSPCPTSPHPTSPHPTSHHLTSHHLTWRRHAGHATQSLHRPASLPAPSLRCGCIKSPRLAPPHLSSPLLSSPEPPRLSIHPPPAAKRALIAQLMHTLIGRSQTPIKGSTAGMLQHTLDKTKKRW